MANQSSELTGQDGILLKAAHITDKFIIGIGKTVAWFNLVLIAVILIQVILRYVFSYASVALEELQWHLYAVCIMFGLSYALTSNVHVRLDLLYGRFSRSSREIIEIVGLIVLVLPWCYVVITHGMDFVASSWRVKESSNSPSGLCCYYIIKSVLPLSFFLLFLAAIARITHSALSLFTRKGGK